MSIANDPRLAKLAEVAVRIGVNLQPGQDLFLTASTVSLPLARLIAAEAYREGAGLVTTLISDDALTLARYENATDESLDRAPAWLYDGMARAFSEGTARMAIAGGDPMLLAAQDPARVSRAAKANAKAMKPAMKFITEFQTNWSIVAYPDPAWARQMFPDMEQDAATAKLADAIFAASRVDQDDPVAAWERHNETLHARQDWLNDQRFDALHYTGPGTDFTLGLADGHKWVGGASPSRKGVICNPNIPTEEVFTTPHAHRADGTLRASKPLAHQGTVIEDIAVRFEGGKIVEASASKGEEVFLKLLDTDEGARRLGEVALVPHGSPISQSGLLFYNTLFDENAASHIALGQCYSECFMDADTLSEDDVTAKGGNASMIHVDWMIGSDAIDIDGLATDGTRTPVMRGGEWAM